MARARSKKEEAPSNDSAPERSDVSEYEPVASEGSTEVVDGVVVPIKSDERKAYERRMGLAVD